MRFCHARQFTEVINYVLILSMLQIKAAKTGKYKGCSHPLAARVRYLPALHYPLSLPH